MKSERASRVFLLLGSIAVFVISVAAGYTIVRSPQPTATEVPAPSPPEEVTAPAIVRSPQPTATEVPSPSPPEEVTAPPTTPDTTQVQRLSRGISSSAAPATPAIAPGTDAGTAVPASPGGSPLFRVQVGAFVRLDNAQERVRLLRSHGYTVTLVDGQPYRVLVGGYLDRLDAEQLAARVRADGFGAALDPVTPSTQQTPSELLSIPAEPATPPGTSR